MLARFPTCRTQKKEKSPHDGFRMRSLVLLLLLLLFTFVDGGLGAALSLIPDLWNADHLDASR